MLKPVTIVTLKKKIIACTDISVANFIESYCREVFLFDEAECEAYCFCLKTEVEIIEECGSASKKSPVS